MSEILTEHQRINIIAKVITFVLWYIGYRVMVMVFNVTFNNISVISWRTVLLVWEIGVPGENNRSAASHWQTFT